MSLNRFAVVNGAGIVTNLIAYDGVSETSYDPVPVPIGDLPVSVGDRFIAGVFYIRPRDGFEYEFTHDGWTITTDGQAGKNAADIMFAENEKMARLAYASQMTSDWKTQLLLSEISDENKAQLSRWMRYIEAVKSVDTSQPVWPDLPL